MLAGHSFAHLPHPTHSPGSILAYMPVGMVIAFLGHTLMQHPQATQAWTLTTAFFLIMIHFLLFCFSIQEEYFLFRDKVTKNFSQIHNVCLAELDYCFTTADKIVYNVFGNNTEA